MEVITIPGNCDTLVYLGGNEQSTHEYIKRNPKRMQRVAKKQTMETGIGTKSQQALKLQQEQNNQERKERSRKKKEAEEQRIFELKQQKKREKHKGH